MNVLLISLQPLLPVDSPLHAKFPPREWAVRLPAAILLVGLTAIGGLLGMVMMKQAQKDKAKRAMKSA
jgi:dolichol phosphate-mannose biosynthesis regulatory protein